MWRSAAEAGWLHAPSAVRVIHCAATPAAADAYCNDGSGASSLMVASAIASTSSPTCRAAIAFGRPIQEWRQTVMEQEILNAVAAEAENLLIANWPKVEAVAGALLERGKLTRDEVVAIVQGGAPA